MARLKSRCDVVRGVGVFGGDFVDLELLMFEDDHDSACRWIVDRGARNGGRIHSRSIDRDREV
jgi:hypothetical protein